MGVLPLNSTRQSRESLGLTGQELLMSRRIFPDPRKQVTVSQSSDGSVKQSQRWPRGHPKKFPIPARRVSPYVLRQSSNSLLRSHACVASLTGRSLSENVGLLHAEYRASGKHFDVSTPSPYSGTGKRK